MGHTRGWRRHPSIYARKRTCRLLAGRDVARRVERKFEIIGEALSQAEHLYPRLRDLVDDSPQIIAFRNRVIHGYSTLDNQLVWSIVQVYLQPLLKQVEALLSETGRLAE